VGHLHLLPIVGFTELAIPAMVVLGFQAHPQFAIAETLQWCTQLELQRTWVNNFGAVRTLRFISQCSTLGVSFTFSVSLSSSWFFCVAKMWWRCVGMQLFQVVLWRGCWWARCHYR